MFVAYFAKNYVWTPLCFFAFARPDQPRGANCGANNMVITLFLIYILSLTSTCEMGHDFGANW